MNDLIVRAIAGTGEDNGAIRAFFISSKNCVEKARQIHNTTPVATAALGRLLTGALLMGQTMKDTEDLLTLQIKGDGLLGGVLATANNHGEVKGYVYNPDADVPNKPNGKLDVSGVVGEGTLTVVKDLGLKEPYVGQIQLVSGEIADDLTYYFAKSEQTPSVVALGVLVDKNYSVKQSGGFLIQLLPFADDSLIDTLEKKLPYLRSVTEMLESGLTPQDMLLEVLGEFGVDITEIIPVMYKCDCSRERVEKALISIGKKELEEIIKKDKYAELCCHFCNEKYTFNEHDLIKLLEI